MEKGDTLPARISTALLLLRIASAMAFLYHGSAILFGSFGGPGPQQFAASHHWPVVMGYLIGLAQFAGVLAVLTGILFRLGAACIAVVMLGAIFLVHLPNGFDIGGRRGICTHTVVTGSRIPLSRTGLVLAGVLASGTPTEILSPAFDVVKFLQSAVLCASPAQTGRSKLVNQEESSSARHFSLADTRIIGFYSGEEPDHRGRLPPRDSSVAR